MTTTTEQLAAALRYVLPMAEARAATLAQAGPRATLGENGDALPYVAERLHVARGALAAYDAERARMTDDGRLLAAIAAPQDDTQAACVALAAVRGYDRIAAALTCLEGVPTAALEELARHPARLDSLRTVARVLGSLPAAQP